MVLLAPNMRWGGRGANAETQVRPCDPCKEAEFLLSTPWENVGRSSEGQ